MSTKTARIEARVDSLLKRKVNGILGKLSMSESEAIRLFYKQIALHKGLPFAVKIPNEETIKAAKSLEANTLPEFDSFDDYLQTLDI